MEDNFNNSDTGQVSDLVDSTTDEMLVKKSTYTCITPADSTTGCETGAEYFSDSESNTDEKASGLVSKRPYKKRSAVERQLETSLNPNFVEVSISPSPQRSRYGRLKKSNFPTDCLPLDIVLNSKSADRVSPTKNIKPEIDTTVKSPTSPTPSAVAEIDKLIDQNRTPVNKTSEQDYNISLTTSNSFKMSPIKIITPNETVSFKINAEKEVNDNDCAEYNNKNSLSLKVSFSIQSNSNNVFTNEMDLPLDNSVRSKDSSVLKTYSRATSTNNSMYDPENDLCLDIVEHLNSNTVNIIENPLKSFSKYNSYNSAESDDDDSSVYNFNANSSTTLRTYSKKTTNSHNEQNITIFTNNFIDSKLKQTENITPVTSPGTSKSTPEVLNLVTKKRKRKNKIPIVIKSGKLKLNAFVKRRDVKKRVMKKKKSLKQSKKTLNEDDDTPNSPTFLHPFASEDLWHSGELAWARIGGYPFWPCLVCPDPKTGACVRRTVQKQRVKDPIQIIHVRFYADNGRRSELRSNFLIPFKGIKEFKDRAAAITAEQRKLHRKYTSAFIIPSKQKQHWQRAVDEAALMLTKSVKERLEYFTMLLEKQKKIKIERKKAVHSGKHIEMKEDAKNDESLDTVSSKSSLVDRKSVSEKENVIVSVKRAAEDNPKSVPLKKRKIIFDEASYIAPVAEKKIVIDKKRLSLTKKVKKLVSDTQETSASQVLPNEELEAPKEEQEMPPKKEIKGKLKAKEIIQMSFLSHRQTNEEEVGASISPKEISKEKRKEIKKKKIEKKKNKSEKKNNRIEKRLKSVIAKKDSKDENSNNNRKRPRSNSVEEEPIKKEIANASDADSPKAKRMKHKHLNEDSKSKRIESLKNRGSEDMKIKCETSDISDSVSEIDNKKDRLEPTSRTSLFKGLSRDKVCMLCEKPGNVLKCRGGCYDSFHYECILASRPPVPEEVEIVATPVIPQARVINMSDFEREANARMQEIMSKAEEHDTDATLSSTTDDDERLSIVENSVPTSTIVEIKSKQQKKMDKMKKLPENGCKVIKHVTGDGTEEKIINESPPPEPIIDIYSDLKCNACLSDEKPPCFICQRYTTLNSLVTERQKCSFLSCGKYFHFECLKLWPQTKYGSGPQVRTKMQRKLDAVQETLTCPYHLCHTCVSDDPRGVKNRLGKDILSKCVRCPTAYHTDIYCIPAGSKLITKNQLICPKHYETVKVSKAGKAQHVNASWCFLCAIGGALICCETCPTSFHPECLKISPPEGHFICEDCESGRFPLYEEIVWCKLGQYRWWPARILPPAEVPQRVELMKHSPGEFCVRFFGTLDHYWITRGRVFLFQEGDTGNAGSKKKMDGMFLKALEEAALAFAALKKQNDTRAAENAIKAKPPLYIKIKTNKPVGNVKVMECDVSSMTPCECDPGESEPCSQDADCLNRILLTECNPSVCRAGIRCLNQCFEKRLYPPLEPCRTAGRGWGLKTLANIDKGTFVIEYVGEMIDDEEFKRRIKRKQEMKDENYYFLTIDNNRLLDAGPKGNVARFMNHSCEPNCETQKWTVNGDTRVGLFALTDIPAGTELTFNYNLECAGDKKKCMCGASKCSGFIGAKTKNEDNPKKTIYLNKPNNQLKLKKKSTKLVKKSTKVIVKSTKLLNKSTKEVKKTFKITKKPLNFLKKSVKIIKKSPKIKNKSSAVTSTPMRKIHNGKSAKRPVQVVVPFTLSTGEITINPPYKRPRGRPKKIVNDKFNNVSKILPVQDLPNESNKSNQSPTGEISANSIATDNLEDSSCSVAAPIVNENASSSNTSQIADPLKVKRKRGRPPKNKNVSTSKSNDSIKSISNYKTKNHVKPTAKMDQNISLKNRSKIYRTRKSIALEKSLPFINEAENSVKSTSIQDNILSSSEGGKGNVKLSKNKKLSVSVSPRKKLSIKPKRFGSPADSVSPIAKKIKTKLTENLSKIMNPKDRLSTSFKTNRKRHSFNGHASQSKKYILSKTLPEKSDHVLGDNEESQEMETSSTKKEVETCVQEPIQKRGRGRPKKSDKIPSIKVHKKRNKSLPAKLISTTKDLSINREYETLPAINTTSKVKLPVLKNNLLNMKISEENKSQNILKLQIVPLERSIRGILNTNGNLNLNLNIPESSSVLLNSYRNELRYNENVGNLDEIESKDDYTVENNVLTALELRKKPVTISEIHNNKLITKSEQLDKETNDKSRTPLLTDLAKNSKSEQNESMIKITEDMEIVRNAELIKEDYNKQLELNNKAIEMDSFNNSMSKSDKHKDIETES